MLRRSKKPDQLAEQLAIETANRGLLEERLVELELALDSEGWDALGVDGDRALSRDAIVRIARLCRLNAIKNPLIRRAVKARTAYTFGEGVTESVPGDDAAQAWLADHQDDRGNRRSFFSHTAAVELDRDLQCDGNVFIVLFTDPASGRVRVRPVALTEVTDIIFDPNDRAHPWYYRRETWTSVVDFGSGRVVPVRQVEWHPALWHEPVPADRPDRIGGHQVRWDAPIVHMAADSSSEQVWGIPELFAALDWAKAYKTFLEDWATLVRSLSRFAFKLTAPGRKQAAARAGLAGPTGGPVAGSDAVLPAGYNLEAIPKTGATVAADDGRQLRLMVAAAVDLPDTILSGDADQGNRATAETLDRPTELAMTERQRRHGDIRADVCTWILASGIRAGQIPGAVTIDGDNVAVVDGTGEPYVVQVSWPPILQPDIAGTIDAVITAATLGGHPDAGTIPTEALSRRLLTVLGFERVDDLLDDLATKADRAGLAGDREVTEALAQIAEALR